MKVEFLPLARFELNFVFFKTPPNSYACRLWDITVRRKFGIELWQVRQRPSASVTIIMTRQDTARSTLTLAHRDNACMMTMTTTQRVGMSRPITTLQSGVRLGMVQPPASPGVFNAPIFMAYVSQLYFSSFCSNEEKRNTPMTTTILPALQVVRGLYCKSRSLPQQMGHQHFATQTEWQASTSYLPCKLWHASAVKSTVYPDPN